MAVICDKCLCRLEFNTDADSADRLTKAASKGWKLLCPTCARDIDCASDKIIANIKGPIYKLAKEMLDKTTFPPGVKNPLK